MGNAILKSVQGEHDNTPPPAAPSQPGILSRPQFQSSPSATVDRINFESNHPVPEEPSEHVTASDKAEAKWYTKILGWKDSPPITSEEAWSLAARALVVGGALVGVYEYTKQPNSLPEGVKYELRTLPVVAKLVSDGDGMTVHVNTNDPRLSAGVPSDVQKVAKERSQARAVRDFKRADDLRKLLEDTTEYRFVEGDILARVFRIRLRGIDAPEMNQEYGPDAKTALMKLIQGKPLKIHVYDEDRFNRLVADVYCGGVFVQEKLLKSGYAWHYEVYDKRPEFAQWHIEAKDARRGLWSYPNPVAPWEFKKNDTNKKNERRPCLNGRNSQREKAIKIQAS